jgi:hypothetical protein
MNFNRGIAEERSPGAGLSEPYSDGGFCGTLLGLIRP